MDLYCLISIIKPPIFLSNNVKMSKCSPLTNRPGATKPSNGLSSSGSGEVNRGQTQQSGDIYKQLINNDMVKELDDIEAISQQIFQHAEVGGLFLCRMERIEK